MCCRSIGERLKGGGIDQKKKNNFNSTVFVEEAFYAKEEQVEGGEFWEETEERRVFPETLPCR